MEDGQQQFETCQIYFQILTKPTTSDELLIMGREYIFLD